jgi:hypothetical protein
VSGVVFCGGFKERRKTEFLSHCGCWVTATASRLWYQKATSAGDHLMNKASVDDATSDKRLEEQVDEKFREAFERFQKIYGKGAFDGLAGDSRKGVRRQTK